MWTRAAAAATLAVLWAAPAPAQVLPVGPASRMCALPEVVAAVVSELEKRRVVGTVDARNPGEVTDADGKGARCAVWLRQPAYDTNVAPPVPAVGVSVQQFHVRRQVRSLLVELE